ncbi:MAG TPA: hypothetical protein VMZ53_08880 [Kofleriaceae bacterium]|nr:hypothetical protein [Kofleriaceae bacterium]
MGRWLLVLAVVGACNQAFDLEPTLGPDSDGDGIADGDDNCLLVGNHDQANEDHDALGDACDPCVAGSQLGIDGDRDGVDDACDACLEGRNSDEDDDGVLDGCDDCPADADADQLDSDGDGVGDACDIGPAVQNTRLLFDGFAPPVPHWDTGFWEWRAVDGSFGPVTPIRSKYDGAWNPDIVVPGRRWYLDTSIGIFADSAFDGAYIKLVALTSLGGFTARDCGIQFNQGQWRDPVTSTVIVVGAATRLRLVDTGAVVQCWINGTLMHTKPSTDPTTAWLPFLQTNTQSEFRWLDVVP